MLKKAVLGIVLAVLAVKLLKLWPSSCLCTIPGRLDGRVVLITDGASFLGPETAAEFARRGAKVLIAGPSPAGFESVRSSILQDYGVGGLKVNEDIASEELRQFIGPVNESQFVFLEAHLNSLASVRKLATDVAKITDRLDFLVNNAVVNHGPYRLTMDKLEMTMAIGHLAHYLLTDQLFPLMAKSKPRARVIIISSAEHYAGSFADGSLFVEHHEFNTIKAFSKLKLANVLHGVVLAKKSKGTTVLPVSLHPGYVLPQIGILTPTLFGAFFKTRWEAAQTVMQAALADDLQPGGYYDNCMLTKPNAEALNETIVEMFRKESTRIVHEVLKKR
ncbi:hypothetical protein SprV_0301326300 [Sparganum proliferum]